MENYLYGRLTTLNYLRDRRDDPRRHPLARKRADQALRKIVDQIRDRKLMKLRTRLIKAQQYDDLHAVWMVENQIRAYERNFEWIEATEYTARDEDA